jgi:hypothetical protein
MRETAAPAGKKKPPTDQLQREPQVLTALSWRFSSLKKMNTGDNVLQRQPMPQDPTLTLAGGSHNATAKKKAPYIFLCVFEEQII